MRSSRKLLAAVEVKLENELACARGVLQHAYAERKRLQDAQHRASAARSEQERALGTPALRIDCQLRLGALAYLARLHSDVRSCAVACTKQDEHVAKAQQDVLAVECKRAVLETLRRRIEQEETRQSQREAQKEADKAWIARTGASRAAAQKGASC